MERQDRPIVCPYNGAPREIYPEVCEWHRDMNDPECRKQHCEWLMYLERICNKSTRTNDVRSPKT